MIDYIKNLNTGEMIGYGLIIFWFIFIICMWVWNSLFYKNSFDDWLFKPKEFKLWNKLIREWDTKVEFDKALTPNVVHYIWVGTPYRLISWKDGTLSIFKDAEAISVGGLRPAISSEIAILLNNKFFDVIKNGDVFGDKHGSMFGNM